jgi:hypothetical protein
MRRLFYHAAPFGLCRVPGADSYSYTRKQIISVSTATNTTIATTAAGFLAPAATTAAAFARSIHICEPLFPGYPIQRAAQVFTYISGQ